MPALATKTTGRPLSTWTPDRLRIVHARYIVAGESAEAVAADLGVTASALRRRASDEPGWERNKAFGRTNRANADRTRRALVAPPMTSQQRQSAASAWTDERVETLKKLWAEGASGSEISKAVGGGITRNAVIGKVHRLGLAGRAEPSAPRANRPRKAPKPKALYRAPSPPVRAEPVIEVDEGPGLATVITLSAHMCRWPIGDPSSEAFTYCGKHRDGGKAYCAGHAKRAYQPCTPRTSASELVRSVRRYV